MSQQFFFHVFCLQYLEPFNISKVFFGSTKFEIDHSSSIKNVLLVAIDTCGVHLLKDPKLVSNSYMLRVNNTGGHLCQIWPLVVIMLIWFVFEKNFMLTLYFSKKNLSISCEMFQRLMPTQSIQ